MKVSLTENLQKAVMSKDIAAARSAILTEVRNDRTREEPQALRLADLVSKELPGLFEPDNGFCSSLSDSAVTNELWTSARSAMMLNFSRERLCLIETIVRELRAKDNKPHSSPDVRRPIATQKSKLRKFVSVGIWLCVGIIVICLVVVGLKNRRKLQTPDGIVKERVTASPTDYQAGRQCPWPNKYNMQGYQRKG